MPYIKEHDRRMFHKQIINIVETIDEPGELCYCIYTILKELTDRNRKFKTIASIIGEVECAKLEYYRRIASPYEDIKFEENGDIQ